MESPDAHGDPGKTVVHLIDALHDMRDALVKASLILQDFQFDFDSVQRSAAVEHSKELIEKVKPR